MGGEPAGSATRSQAPSRAAEAALLALALGASVLLLRALLGFEYGLDQAIYSAVADAVLDGGVPYRDAWDFKPPGIYFAYALARAGLGSGMHAVRGLEALGLASLVVAFAVFSRRHLGRAAPGLLGGALAVTGHVWTGFWHTAQPESFGAVLVAWALVLATSTPRGRHAAARQRLAWAGAGAAYALAGLMKPPLGAGLLVSAGFAARERWRADRRLAAAVRPALAFAAGAFAPPALALLYFAGHGALSELHQTFFVFVPGYVETGGRTGDLLVAFFRAVEFLLFRFSLLNLVGLALFFCLPRIAAREMHAALHVLGVLALQLAGIALQDRYYAYHFGGAVPLVALLAGWGYWKLARLGRSGWIGVALALALVFLLANRNGSGEHAIPGGFFERVRIWQDGHVYNAARRRVAAWVAAHTDPDDAIFVWGFEPGIYQLSARRPASRYVYNVPQRAAWFRDRARALLLDDLRRTAPAAILVQEGDHHGKATGSLRDSVEELETFPALSRLLADCYARAASMDGFTIHLRAPGRGAGCPTAPAPPAGPAASRGPPDRAGRP